MQTFEYPNLLKGTLDEIRDSDAYLVKNYSTTEPLVVGKTYTISAYVEKIERSQLDVGKSAVLTAYDGAGWNSFGDLKGNVPGLMTRTFTYSKPFPDHAKPDEVSIYNTPPNGTGVTRRASFRNVMLVEGAEPAAWAPAEGETLAGGVLS